MKLVLPELYVRNEEIKICKNTPEKNFVKRIPLENTNLIKPLPLFKTSEKPLYLKSNSKLIHKFELWFYILHQFSGSNSYEFLQVAR